MSSTNTSNVTKQQVNELRNLFLQKYNTNPPNVPFHPVDLERIQDNDIWLTKFLEAYDLDVNVSLEKLWFTCEWRQEYKAYDLCESDLIKDYLTDGVIFAHNRDVDGKPLLIFQTRNHVKGSKSIDDLTRVVVYYIERLHRQTNMDKITLFFDMTGTGLANMDIDFIQCVIDTFKLYYPDALNYILVFEMTWILNAVFKIIKALLPEKAQAILKVIKKKDLHTYVDKDNCLTGWGGNDDYSFVFVPENRSSNQKEQFCNDNNNNPDKKMVHFANTSPKRESAVAANMNNDLEIIGSPGETMLRLEPVDVILFKQGESSESTINLQNISSYSVTFKIQTTSPEKFRVRPRCGVLKIGETMVISIVLKAEHLLSDNARDKFLIMGLPANNLTNTQQIAEFWRKQDLNGPNVEQHRLCCMYKDDALVTLNNSPRLQVDAPISLAKSANKEQQTRDQYMTITADLERQLRCTQILQIITLICLLLLSGAVSYLLMLKLCDGGCFGRDTTDGQDMDKRDL